MRIRRVVTTRSGGYSSAPYDSFNLADNVGDDQEAVAANRARLATELGLPERRITWMEQVHGRTVTTVDAPLDGAAEVTDVLVTSESTLALATLVADCVPVLLADAQAGVIAAVHAGRVGARIGVVPAALEAMRSLGAHTSATEVLLGPAICGECYEVPRDMAADVDARLPGSACRSNKGTQAIDLRAGLWNQLAAAGVAKIGVDPRCTAEEDSLFSHRRQGTTGRIAALTWLDPS